MGIPTKPTSAKIFSSIVTHVPGWFISEISVRIFLVLPKRIFPSTTTTVGNDRGSWPCSIKSVKPCQSLHHEQLCLMTLELYKIPQHGQYVLWSFPFSPESAKWCSKSMGVRSRLQQRRHYLRPPSPPKGPPLDIFSRRKSNHAITTITSLDLDLSCI